MADRVGFEPTELILSKLLAERIGIEPIQPCGCTV